MEMEAIQVMTIQLNACMTPAMPAAVVPKLCPTSLQLVGLAVLRYS